MPLLQVDTHPVPHVVVDVRDPDEASARLPLPEMLAASVVHIPGWQRRSPRAAAAPSATPTPSHQAAVISAIPHPQLPPSPCSTTTAAECDLAAALSSDAAWRQHCPSMPPPTPDHLLVFLADPAPEGDPGPMRRAAAVAASCGWHRCGVHAPAGGCAPRRRVCMPLLDRPPERHRRALKRCKLAGPSAQLLLLHLHRASHSAHTTLPLPPPPPPCARA